MFAAECIVPSLRGLAVAPCQRGRLPSRSEGQFPTATLYALCLLSGIR